MKNLIIVSFLFLFNLIYSCTQKDICDDGIKLLNLIRVNLDKKYKCTTSINDLESISKEMFDLEDHALENLSLKLWYARYLCSQYSITNGFIISDDILKHNEEIIIQDNNNMVTNNYIKGLDLFAQLCFSSPESNMDYDNEFKNYLAKLKMDDHCIGKYIEELEKISHNLELKTLDASKIKKSIITKFLNLNIHNCYFYAKNGTFILNDIVKGIFYLLKRINNQNVLDGFLKYCLCSSSYIQPSSLYVVKTLSDKNQNLSDYMKYIYSYEHDRKKYYNNSYKCIVTKKTCNYLLSLIINKVSFKFPYVGYKVHRRIAKFFELSKEVKNAIVHYETALNYKYMISSGCNLAKIYFNLEDYEKSLKQFKKAKKKIQKDKDKKIFRSCINYYLDALRLTGYQKEYEEELFIYNKKAAENLMKKNKIWVTIIETDRELRALKAKENEAKEKKREALVIKRFDLLKEKKIDKKENFNFHTSCTKNLKKEYPNKIIKKEKTHGTADPSYTVEERVTNSTVKKPLVRIEQFISGNSLKIFRKLFGPYESNLMMDSKQTISKKDIKTLMDALGFPYSFSDGKGSHSKGIIKSIDEDDNKKEYMIIISCDGPNIKSYCIKSLRESFLAIDLYPEDLKENLVKLGLVDNY